MIRYYLGWYLRTIIWEKNTHIISFDIIGLYVHILIYKGIKKKTLLQILLLKHKG